jgi:ABC-2 type transport system permease protein
MLKKILLVVKREYLSRVRKRSFFIMTMLAPLLIVLFYGLIFYFAFNRDLGDSKKRIYVSDQSGLFIGKIKSKPNLEFFYGLVNSEAEELRLIGSEGFYSVLTIPKSNYDSIHGATMVANDQLSIT